ncbi:MAG TPA: TylF/MycF/NovP-related O-methyltransferase [Terriglobia bacterium]|nr:TylF/MycF/NovP-related O-methyltransferase [Terriglobia bacterium]
MGVTKWPILAGVGNGYQGAETRYRSKLLRNPSSKLHGVDTFEGLPENWLPDRPAGHFSTGGEPPKLHDPRIRIFKGRFEETLPGYALPPHELPVVNLDADLYASSSFVRSHLESAIRPGTYLQFDEFNHQSIPRIARLPGVHHQDANAIQTGGRHSGPGPRAFSTSGMTVNQWAKAAYPEIRLVRDSLADACSPFAATIRGCAWRSRPDDDFGALLRGHNLNRLVDF